MVGLNSFLLVFCMYIIFICKFNYSSIYKYKYNTKTSAWLLNYSQSIYLIFCTEMGLLVSCGMFSKSDDSGSINSSSDFDLDTCFINSWSSKLEHGLAVSGDLQCVKRSSKTI